jgi:hypothetical protein
MMNAKLKVVITILNYHLPIKRIDENLKQDSRSPGRFNPGYSKDCNMMAESQKSGDRADIHY